MSLPIIEVQGLGKQYRLGAIGATTLREDLTRIFRRENEPRAGDFWALRDVSFRIGAGNVVGVVGRNGAGKSTLLKLLSRVTEPTEGRALLRGRVASLLEVGTGFHPDLTGRENIFLNGAILGMKRHEIARRFDEIVSFAEISRFIDTPVKHYSSGMYIRLAFAVAAHLEPEILIIDEVLAVGDAEFQKKCLGTMSRVAASGRTVFFVSHNATAVRSLCSHALLLEQGRATRFGTAPEVLEHYLQKQAEKPSEACWLDPATAPGNAKVQLRQVRLVFAGTDRVAPDVHSPFAIEITYWNHLTDSCQNVSLVLNTLAGVCVLNTYGESQPVRPGLVTATCHVPGDLLSDETYQVDVLIVKDGSSVLYSHREAITFTVADGRRQGAWHGKHVGVVRPNLAWEIRSSPGLAS